MIESRASFQPPLSSSSSSPNPLRERSPQWSPSNTTTLHATPSPSVHQLSSHPSPQSIAHTTTSSDYNHSHQRQDPFHDQNAPYYYYSNPPTQEQHPHTSPFDSMEDSHHHQASASSYFGGSVTEGSSSFSPPYSYPSSSTTDPSLTPAQSHASPAMMSVPLPFDAKAPPMLDYIPLKDASAFPSHPHHPHPGSGYHGNNDYTPSGRVIPLMTEGKYEQEGSFSIEQGGGLHSQYDQHQSSDHLAGDSVDTQPSHHQLHNSSNSEKPVVLTTTVTPLSGAAVAMGGMEKDPSGSGWFLQNVKNTRRKEFWTVLVVVLATLLVAIIVPLTTRGGSSDDQGANGNGGNGLVGAGGNGQGGSSSGGNASKPGVIVPLPTDAKGQPILTDSAGVPFQTSVSGGIVVVIPPTVGPIPPTATGGVVVPGPGPDPGPGPGPGITTLDPPVATKTVDPPAPATTTTAVSFRDCTEGCTRKFQECEPPCWTESAFVDCQNKCESYDQDCKNVCMVYSSCFQGCSRIHSDCLTVCQNS